MSYTGAMIQIPVAQGGLLVDTSPDLIPNNNLIRANNVKINQGIVEKHPGSLRWNYSPLSAGIVALLDYWPVPGKQYLIAVTRDGRVWRIRNRFDVVEIVPTTNKNLINQSGFAPTTLTVTERVHICVGGKEFLGTGASNQPAKVFIFTGNDQVQVIYGEETERHNLLNPATDWDGTSGKVSYPTFGIVFQSRLFLLGNTNFPYFVYASSDTYGTSNNVFQYGHEDFSQTTFNSALFNVFPGDGERNVMLFPYKGVLWLLKYPRGLYSLQIPDVGTPAGWFFNKVNDDVGTASITGVAAIQDDVWVSNAHGALQSVQSTLNLGGVVTANMLKAMKIERFIQDRTSALGFGERQCLWHQPTSTAYFLYRARSSNFNSFLLVMDFSQGQPMAYTVDKDQPNILAIRRDVNQKEQIIYGSEDGYVYFTDRSDHFVGETNEQTLYASEFQTPHLILGQSNNFMFNLSAQNDKLFDFLEIEYIPTGDTALLCDVYVDGRATETLTFNLGRGNRLGQFVLGASRLQGRSTRKQRKEMHGRGRTISFRFYDQGSNRNFKLVGLTVYARLGGSDEKGSQDAGTKENG